MRLVLLVVAVAGLGVGCGSGEAAPAGAEKLSFELTDAGCVPHSTSAPAGPIVFEVENAGTTAVTEIEVMEGDTILGEKEDLSDGLSGSFSLTLDAGDYTIYCPGGSDEEGTLSVTGKIDAQATLPDEKDATAQYRDYLARNADKLVEQTEPFEIEASFEDVYAALDPYRQGKGFVSYAGLTKADTRKLAQEIDALAELLSQAPAQIVG